MPTAQTQVDTVYVKPAPPQRVIHVTRRPPRRLARQTPRGGRHRPSEHGGDDDGHGDDGSGVTTDVRAEEAP